MNDFGMEEPNLAALGLAVPQMEVVATTDKTFAAGSVSMDMLTPEEQAKVEEFAKKIDIADTKMVNSYGASAQKGIAAFSTAITSNTKTKEFGDAGDSLRELEIAISSTLGPEKKGILGIFKKVKNKANYLIANYQNAETNIAKIEKDLQKHQQCLLKDVYVFDEMYKMNLDYYKEITMYIIAGKKALEKARNTTLVELKQKAESTGEQIDLQTYRDFENSCVRFEKKIAALEESRIISIQLAPQIRQLQNVDQELVDKLGTDIINTIPVWRNQMVLALGIEHAKRALEAQSAVTELTNEMLRRNAETLKMGAIEAAQASERGIVDVETIRKCNEDIITSINEVVRIHAEGAAKRAEAEIELAKLEEELKQALLSAGSN